MNQKEMCSLVDDLLPLYAERLVSEESKEKIEEHLKGCKKCKKRLDEIKKDNKLFSKEENINGEIKCIKKIKRKIIIKIILAVVISALLTFFCAYVYDTYRIIKGENGKYIIYNINTGNIQKGINASNMFAEYTINNNGENIKYSILFTFNKNDICINARTIISGYDKQELDNFKDIWEGSDVISNMEIKDNRIYMNDNQYIGKEKQKIIENLKQKNSTIQNI